MWGVPKEHAPTIIGGACIGAKAMCAFMGGQALAILMSCTID